MLIKISFLRTTLPFSGSPGLSVVFAFMVSGQSAGPLCFLISTYSHFCLLLPGIKAGLCFGAICPGCRGQTVLLISAVKYLQEIHLGVSAHWKPRQPMVALENPLSLQHPCQAQQLPLPSQMAVVRARWPKPIVLIWG